MGVGVGGCVTPTDLAKDITHTFHTLSDTPTADINTASRGGRGIYHTENRMPISKDQVYAR